MLSVILSVNDIDASVKFYVDVLGFAHDWSMQDDDGTTNFASVSLAGSTILLGVIDFVPEANRDTLGAGVQLHIELPSEIDIDAIYKQAKSAGATITREIEDRDWGERAFAVKDPDGYHTMIAQPFMPDAAD